MMAKRRSKNSIITAIFVAVISCLFGILLYLGASSSPGMNMNVANFALAGVCFQSIVYLATVIFREKAIADRVLQARLESQWEKIDSERSIREIERERRRVN